MSSLLGRLHTDGRTVTAVPVTDGLAPAQMLPVLRRIYSGSCGGELRLRYARLLVHGWEWLGDTDGPPDPRADHRTQPGLGVCLTDPPEPVDLVLAGPCPPAFRSTGWLYLLDDRDDAVIVHEATVHGRWARHSHHPLRTMLPDPLPPMLGLAGDPGGSHVHRWRPATVSLDGLHTAWPARICTAEYDRGVVVASLDPDTAADVADTIEVFYRDLRPGSGLPSLHVHPDRIGIDWFTGSGHEMRTDLTPGPDGRYVIGPHVLPWILSAEDAPAYRADRLRNGTPPILAWLTEHAVHARFPVLAGHPLPRIAAAMHHLGGGPAVLASTGGSLRHVWLVAPTHVLVLTPSGRSPHDNTVTLPRPLAGHWDSDPPVPVLTADQVAHACADLAAATTTAPPHPAGPSTVGPARPSA